jgi:hypothetical protein
MPEKVRQMAEQWTKEFEAYAALASKGAEPAGPKKKAKEF